MYTITTSRVAISVRVGGVEGGRAEYTSCNRQPSSQFSKHVYDCTYKLCCTSGKGGDN